MKFLKIARAAPPAPLDTLGARLSAIVGRGHAEECHYPGFEGPAPPDGVQKRFWTPDELEPQAGDC